MNRTSITRRMLLLAGLCVVALAPVQATTLQRMSFEELTDNSDMIVTGKVTKTWSAWGTGHQYIWTHYEVEVASTQKGTRATRIQISEPGGTVDGMSMVIAGTSKYNVGDEVMLFLSNMPNGLIRTAGWGQGKYTVDKQGRLHGDAALQGVEFAGSQAGTKLGSLDGLTLQEAALHVAARLRATLPTTAAKGKVQ